MFQPSLSGRPLHPHPDPVPQGRGRCRVSGQSPAEEVANTLTHGLGLLLAVAGLVVLVVFAGRGGGALRIVGCTVYGATLVLLFLASTLYHGWPSAVSKRHLRMVDHACIFLLIAGTYTPFTLLLPSRGWGWSLFGVVWGLAGIGIFLKVFMAGRFVLLSTLAYLGMGWLALIAVVPLFRHLSWWVLIWLFVGGLAYSAGTIFFLWRGLPFHHALWHLAVLVGSGCHYIAVFLYAVSCSVP